MGLIIASTKCAFLLCRPVASLLTGTLIDTYPGRGGDKRMLELGGSNQVSRVILASSILKYHVKSLDSS